MRGDDAIFRIGNATGEVHPIIGEGISMALQSAFLLCARLIAAPPAGESLRTWQKAAARAYARDWRRAFVRRHLLAAAFAHAAMGSASGGMLIALTRVFPRLLTAGARWGGKLHSGADPRATIAQRASVKT